MTNKFTGEPAGYGFVNFDSDQKAIYVMHRLGGKVIPNSNPPVRFKLNHNSTRLAPGEPDTSIWVGDLTPEVDDFALYQFFTARYQYVRCAKVVLDENGFSKGYGFVRFGMEAEQQHALANMTGKCQEQIHYMDTNTVIRLRYTAQADISTPPWYRSRLGLARSL